MTPMPNHCNECDKPVVDWDEHARVCEEFASRDKFITFEASISKMKGSFVIVCEFSFDDNLIIVPTLQEAYDYIEMEEIERQLKL